MPAVRVTVLLPVYNGSRYLSEAIDSILAQTLEDFALLVVDDGSTDATPLILDRYEDRRLRVLHRPHEGLIAALNAGLDEVSTEYVARMDADDVSAPERLAKQLALLDRRPDVTVVGTGFRLLSDDGVQGRVPPVFQRDKDLRRVLYLACPFIHGSVMMRTSAVRAAGGYAAGRECAEDYDLWCRIPGRFAQLPEVLYSYRDHDAQTSVEAQERQARVVLEELWARGGPPRRTPVDVVRGMWAHRGELRWYLSWQRGIRRERRRRRRVPRDQQGRASPAA
jgi:glycosyltransferase involved in cell wall biosynthesis